MSICPSPTLPIMNGEKSKLRPRTLNLAFVIKDCEKTYRVLDSSPSEEKIREGKRIAVYFSLINPSDKSPLFEDERM